MKETWVMKWKRTLCNVFGHQPVHRWEYGGHWHGECKRCRTLYTEDKDAP
jgi:hypothetical protein